MRAPQFERLVRRLYSLEQRGMRLDLGGTKSFLKKLGNPERHFSSVLVGGTNGKGSTCSFVSSILKAAGYRVGMYTSPHLVDFRERVRVSGCCIPRDHAYDLLKTVVPVGERGGYSFFETMTAAAFRYFRDRDVELAVAEVGLGGRLDSTNVLNPLVSLITGISIEHSHILGSTLDAIAGEKAAIMRRGKPVVTAARGVSLQALERRAQATGAGLLTVGRDIRLRTMLLSRAGTAFSARGPGRARRNYFTRLAGQFQVRNAGLAILACSCLGGRGFPVSEADMERGVRTTGWPGRLQEWGRDPLFLFDVAHNPEAGASLANALSSLYADRKVIAVVGMVEDKDHAGFLRRVLPCVRHVVFTQASCERALSADRLKEKMPSGTRRWSVVPRVREALSLAASLAGKDELVCVTGSFYTVGEAMESLRIGVTECL
jgi:dihydrofolate synthase/folylpolyglutamate synthase